MKTILQVEDDPNDVFFFQRSMKKTGVPNSIQVASDGQQAIDYLQGAGQFADRQKFPLPALVLLDLKLPYVMGMEVLRWIRQQLATPIVVVMLTSSSEDEDIAAAYRLGANGFLVKPSDASKMDDVVRAISDFWLTHNALPREAYKASAEACSGQASPAINRLPTTMTTSYETWPPVASQQTCGKNPSHDF